ncbi:hypothetical protein L1987_24337 [Smallanthus sonchifolius]|uniref:Uncharacterized protein n=1 Tax=Smallanthus sonchifolius TaxID=185202 RepID=A0ACB9IJX9_9ASTR|nr:hypothetical protein L1987_24337 [Smallanthus sonchifolius]
MTELNSNEEPHVLPPKRKQTSQTLNDDSTKKPRPDNEAPASVEDKTINENQNKDEIEEEEDCEGEDEVDSDDEDDDDDDDEVEQSNGINRKER